MVHIPVNSALQGVQNKKITTPPIVPVYWGPGVPVTLCVPMSHCPGVLVFHLCEADHLLFFEYQYYKMLDHFTS